MKRYAFPITLALVCFIGGYATCYSRMHFANKQAEGGEITFGRVYTSKSAARFTMLGVAEGGDAPMSPKVEGWNQGLIQPTLPPKRVAP